MTNPSNEISPAKALGLSDLVEYSDGAVVSRTLHKSQAGTITLFAFDAGQGLSEHSAPFDAYVQVLDGTAEITVGGDPVRASVGQIVRMPANIGHSLHAPARFKMMLVMIRG
jgi:quercetin dioxygenase-like cupin family protein